MKKLAALFFALALAAQAIAATIPFQLEGLAGIGLLPGNETGAVSGAPGTGDEMNTGILFDDVTKILTIEIGWGSANGFTDLTSTVSGMHIHGATADNSPTSFSQNAGVVVNFQTNSVTTGYTAASFTTSTSASSGFVTGQVTLDTTRESHLMNGRLYINIHTSTNGGGEIRGNLIAVPEPGSASLLALGLLSLVATRRARAKAA